MKKYIWTAISIMTIGAHVAIGQVFTDVDSPQYHGFQELNKAVDANFAEVEGGPSIEAGTSTNDSWGIDCAIASGTGLYATVELLDSSVAQTDTDYVSIELFEGVNDSAEDTVWGKMYIVVDDNTTNTEDSSIELYQPIAGVQTKVLDVSAGVVTVPGSAVITGALGVSLVTDATTKDTGSIITEGGIGIEKALFVGSATASSSKDTGAIICEGGIGTEEDVYAGGNIVAVGDVSGATVASITAANLVDKSATESISGVWTHSTNVIVSGMTVSSSKDTGCVVVEGGIGVEEDVYVGGQVVVTGALTASGLLDSDTTGVTGSFTIATNLAVTGTVTVVGASTLTGGFDSGAASTATNITMDAGSTLAAKTLTVATAMTVTPAAVLNGGFDSGAASTATNITMDIGSTLAADNLTVASEATVDGKYAVVGPNAATGLMVQAASIIATGTTMTNTFGVEFGATPIVTLTYYDTLVTTNQLWLGTVTSSNFISFHAESINYNYIAVGARP